MIRLSFLFIALLIFPTLNQAQNDTDPEVSCDQVETDPDTYPEFFTGRDGLLNYLKPYSLIPLTKKKTDYPVRIQLLVCSSGKFQIKEIVLSDAPFETLEVESRRLVKMLPAFVPATKDGKPVASYYWIQLNYKPQKEVVPEPQIILIPME